MQVSNFDKETGGPMTAYMAPKLDHFLAKVHDLTGFVVPIAKSDYPRILLTAAVCEGLGAMLFVLDISFGAVVLIMFTVPVTVIMHVRLILASRQIPFLNDFPGLILSEFLGYH